MQAWMLMIGCLFRSWFATPKFSGRRVAPRAGRFGFEGLEGREVMSGVIPFATLAGQVAAPGQVTQLTLQLAANQVSSTRSTPVLIGFYAETPAGSTINPAITEVDGNATKLAPLALPNHTKTTPPKTLFLTEYLPVTGQGEDITVDVTGLDATYGDVVVQAFLPGDVNGDRTVDASDLAAVNAAYGSAIGQAKYNGQADFNGDGHVGCIDRRLTTLNQGVSIGAFPVTTSAAVPVATTAVAVATTPVVATSVPVVAASVPYTISTVQSTPVTTTTSGTYTTPTGTLVAIPSSTTGTTYAYGQAVTSGTTTTPGTVYVYGQPTVQGATTTTANTGTTYVYGQPVTQGVTTTAANTGTTYVYSQPVAQGTTTATGQATTSGQVYVLYPNTTTQTPVAVTNTVATPVATTVSIPTTSTTTTTSSLPATSTGYQPGESGPVYYYGQSVVQAPTTSQTLTG